jgi:predicted transport protein
MASRSERQFKARIVHLIIAQETEEALELLSRYHHVTTPKLKIGMPKGDVKRQGCYAVGDETIYVAHRDNLYNPYIILHEFYHHLRTKGAMHRGTEKNADKFAKDYIATYYRFFGA